MPNHDGYKICGSCNIEKPLADFYKKLNGTSSKCKSCVAIDNKNYREKHRDELNTYRRNYYLDHKDELIQYGLEYRADPENKKLISESKKEYFENNKTAIYVRNNKRRKTRRDTDPFYRLRNLVSRSVNRMLKLNCSSKKGGSIKDKLSYSIEELKEHIEKKFEPWMTWDNQGKYDPKTWNDNDPTTWTWHLDHIIPQSDLPYSSMEDENFKKCWSLENLRPLSSKINLLDGTTRKRHR